MFRKFFNESHPFARVIAIILFIVGLLIYLTWIGFRIGPNLVTGDWINHSNEDYCYSFEYPGRWRLYVSGDEGWHGNARPNQRAMLLEPKPYSLGRIYFTIDQIPMESPTLEDVAAWSLQYSSKNESFTDLLPYIVDEKPASIRIFSSDQSETTEVYIVRENDGLVLRMSTKSNYHYEALNTFQEIIDSFVYEQCSGNG